MSKINTINDGVYTENEDLITQIQQELPTKIKTDFVNLMLDIETLGLVKHGLVPIVSLSLVPFNEYEMFNEMAIYAKMDMEQYDDMSVDVSMSTVVWWMGQSDDARKEFVGGKSNLSSILNNITEYIRDIENYTGKKVKVWAKSPDFDLVLVNKWADELMIEDFYIGRYSNYRCVRTVTDGVPLDDTDITQHNSFQDCVKQIRDVQKAWVYKKGYQ